MNTALDPASSAGRRFYAKTDPLHCLPGLDPESTAVFAPDTLPVRDTWILDRSPGQAKFRMVFFQQLLKFPHRKFLQEFSYQFVFYKYY